MSALKEFANFILLNVANLAATYDRLLAENSDGYPALPAESRMTAARRLIKTVAEACEAETPDPLHQLFEARINTFSLESSSPNLPRPLAEIEYLGQTLTPVVTTLEAGKFLWQMLADARSTILENIIEAKQAKISPQKPIEGERPPQFLVESLREVTNILISRLDRETVLTKIMEQLRQVIDYDSGAVFLLEDDSLVLSTGIGVADEYIGFRVPLSSQLVEAQVFNQKQPLIIENVRLEPRWPIWSEDDPIRGWMAAPLLLGQEAIGILTTDSHQVGAYDEQDAQVLQTFANQVATAIENARLFEEVQRERQLLLTLIDNLPDHIYAKDLARQFTLVNMATAQSMGVTTPKGLIGKTDSDFHPPELAAQYYADEQAVLDSGQPLLNREELFIGPDGHKRWLLTTKTPLRDNEGRIVGLVGVNRDITERKQTEDQLRKLSRAVEQSANTVVITNPAGYIEYVNPKFTQTTGYTREEAIGQHTRLLKSGVTSAEEYKNLWETISAGAEWQGEFCNKKKNGELYWEFASISPIKDENGVVTHFLAVKEDITVRKQVEEALRESEERSAAIVGQAADGVVIVQANQLKFLNKAQADMLGYSPEEMINTPFINYVAPESRYLVAARVKARLAGENVPPIYEAKLLCKDGTVIDGELSAGVIKYLGEDADLGLIRNITARKQAEAAVRESQQRFQGLVETLSDWIWEVDQNGTYTYVSPKVKDLLGYEPEEVLGKTPFDFMPPEEAQRVVGVFGPLLATQQPLVALENTNRHKDGHLVVFETSGVPFFDAEEQFMGYRGTDRNITRRKQLEQQIQQSLARLTHQVQAITEVGQQISGTLTLNDLFQEVVDLMQTQFGYYHAQIYTLTEGDMVLQAGTGEVGWRLKERNHKISLSTEQSLVVRAVWEGESVLVGDVSEKPTWLPNPLLPETKAELAVPITLGAEVIGVLDVQSDKVNGLNEEDRLLLIGLCGQIAIAVESRRSEDERARLLVEAERRARREQTIREITEQMRTANSLQELVRITARELGQRLSAGHAIVELGVEAETEPTLTTNKLSNNGH